MRWVGGAMLAFTIALSTAACKRAYRVGDHVLIDWRGADHPAVIVGLEGPSRFRVHYDGFGEDWDESITAVRVRGRLSAVPADNPAIQRATRPREPTTAGSAVPANMYRIGDRVRVEWHGATYTATVISALLNDRYRVHYEGYGSEWDENVGLNRIQRK